jgi:hypothetical protein
MEKADLIAADDFCIHHEVSWSFITALHEAGLIEITTIEERPFLPADYLSEVEKLVRLHTDLNINPEGVEAIAHMLQRMKEMQQELHVLRQRLKLYE